ncbi:MAG: hypothetical protein HY293_15950, partial [Planctomycetes bacterium]|nr:hypothetical protein [Planctomycetota bacterium]
MDTETYSNAGVIEHSSKNFVNVLVYMDGANEVAKKFGIEALPTTFLLSPDGERVRKWEGFLGPDEYKKTLDGAVEAVRKLKPLEAQLKTDPDNFELNREAAGHYQ